MNCVPVTEHCNNIIYILPGIYNSLSVRRKEEERRRLKNNIYFVLFVFAVICGIPFVAHQTYWWCALYLFSLHFIQIQRTFGMNTLNNLQGLNGFGSGKSPSYIQW